MFYVSYFLLFNITLFTALFTLLLLSGKENSFGTGARFAFFVFLFTPLLIFAFSHLNKGENNQVIKYIIYFIYSLWIISLIASIVYTIIGKPDLNVSLLVIMMWLLSNLLIYVLTDTEICKGKELKKDKKSIPEKLGSIFKVFDPTELAAPTCEADAAAAKEKAEAAAAKEKADAAAAEEKKKAAAAEARDSDQSSEEEEEEEHDDTDEEGCEFC